MKINMRVFVVGMAICGTALPPFPLSSWAQEPLSAGPPPTGVPPADAPPADPQAHLRSPAELDALLGPIALYPDPLLAQILPAATAPQDIVMASRYVAAKKDPNAIDRQPWEESVKALARYPDVLQMMDEKLDWTSDLGEAFVDQPKDVFASVQRLRAQAEAVGNLKTSPQQTIIVEKEVIRIVPADPQVIYVPTYSPTVIYTQAPPNPAVPLLAFGAGFAMGIWIHNELDWHHHGVYYHNSGWHGGGYGGNNISINNSTNINIGNGNTNIGGGGGNVWKPNRPGNRPGTGSGANRPGGGNGNIGNNRPGAGNGNGGNNRPGTGNGNGGNNRPGAGNGQGGNNKPGFGSGGAGGNNKPAFGGGAQTRPAAGGQRPGSGGGQSNPFNREASKPRGNAGGGGGARPSARPAATSRGGGGGGGARPAPAAVLGGGGGAARGGGGGGRGAK